MDPPFPQLYTIDDFLSEKRIAIRFNGSAAYHELCKILIANGYDQNDTLERELPRLGDGIVYRHHDNHWVQKGPCTVLAELGYIVIEAEQLIDLLPDFPSKVDDILNLLEDE